MTSLALSADFVPETRFGTWFLGTETWVTHVLKVAINDLYRLIDAPTHRYPVVVDVGCGQGRSFLLLQQKFSPEKMYGIECDEKNLATARARIAHDGVSVELLQNDCAAIDLPDNVADLVFCHQTFHHLVHQEQALREFYRILKPGGLLLFAESTRAYIHSWMIRLLFRHPMHVQRSADEYMQMIRTQGFKFEVYNVSLPYLWWSRSDLGLLEKVGIPPPQNREETLVNLVASKPLELLRS